MNAASLYQQIHLTMMTMKL